MCIYKEKEGNDYHKNQPWRVVGCDWEGQLLEAGNVLDPKKGPQAITLQLHLFYILLHMLHFTIKFK